MSCLQSDFEIDENDGRVLTAKDGTKWKKYKSVISPHETCRLQCPSPKSYACRNIQAGSPASAWNLFTDKLILEHIRKCTIHETTLLVYPCEE